MYIAHRDSESNSTPSLTKPLPLLAQRLAQAPARHPGLFARDIWSAEKRPAPSLWEDPERRVA